MPKHTQNQLEETVRIRDLTLADRWTGIRVESKVIQDQDHNQPNVNPKRWSLRSYLTDGNTDQPLNFDGISFPTDNDLRDAQKSKSLDILPENLFIWSKSGSESVSNEDDSNQIDIDALPIDQLISVVPKYLSLTQESMSQTGLRGQLMTYDNHLSLSGDKEVTDENEFLKLTYTESALFAYTKDLFNDPWNVKRLQDETFDSQKSEFDQLMNSQEDRGLRGMMKNWKRGVEMNYELRCHRSNLKSHKEFVSLLPVGTDREEKLKREKSERMMRDRSRQIRGLEDKVINMRRSVERDIERVGNGSEAWGWPEDIDDWRDMLDRLNREATTKQDDPVLTSPCGGANDIVFDKGEEKTMVDRVSEGNTTGLSSGLDKARDSGLDTNDGKTEVHTPRDLGGTALGPQLITRNNMTEWDHEKGGWKKPWEEKKGATLISESETAADNSDNQVFTIVSNRKEKQKKNKISNNSEQRQRCQIEPMTGRSDDLSYRVKTGKSMGSRKTRTSTASMPPTQPISTALKEHPEMNANDDKPNDLDDLVEIAHDQSDQDTASSDRAGTLTPSDISEVTEPKSSYPIANGQIYVPLSSFGSLASKSKPLNPKAAVFEPRDQMVSSDVTRSQCSFVW